MFYVLVIFAVIAYIDLRVLFKQDVKKDRYVVLAIFTFVLIVCLLQAGGINVPSPMMAVDDLIRGIGLSYPPLK